jgi:FkbM family methyltransferase
MRKGMGKTLHRKMAEKNIAVGHVCEVGVFLPEMSNIIDFIVTDHVKTTLVEPDPRSIAAIREYFRDYKNVTLLPYAVYDHDGELELVQRNASTFVAELPYSPALVNDNYVIRKEDTFSVSCKRFDRIDDGSIDLLSVDTEGSEWYVIKYLKSRPAVISVETHGKSYLNPFLKEITEWMTDNGYARWYMDGSDTVYYREGALRVTPVEKIGLFTKGLRVSFRRARKRAGKILFGRSKTKG